MSHSPASIDLAALMRTATETVRDMWACGPIQRVHASDMSPERFEREFVARNVPVVITHALDAWPAFHTWTFDTIRERYGDLPVTLSLTPNGLADAVTYVHEVDPSAGVFDPTCDDHSTCPRRHTQLFMTCHNERVTLADVCRMLTGSDAMTRSRNVVPYLSHQNDSLRSETPAMAADMGPGFRSFAPAHWQLEAVNLWMGDERSVTSAHKDHYENLYAVLRGEKVFHLCPPSDILWMHQTAFPTAAYRMECTSTGAAHWSVALEKEADGTPRMTSWIPFDMSAPDLQTYPLATHLHVQEVRVRPGEVLYLPALWFHRVTQTCPTIAVNAWHDMDFMSPTWAYYNMCAEVAKVVTAHHVAGPPS